MNSKVRMLCVLSYLEQNTDENHACTTKELIKMLEAKGFGADRKSIYNDIHSLSEYGYDIEGLENGRYRLVSRDFELAELKLLVDSIQYSRFITSRKTNELISKIEKLCSKDEATKLKKQIVFQTATKSMNETVYYNVDKITTAIVSDRRISFKYFEYTVSGKQYRKNGKLYVVSPFSMIVDDENYYLLAYSNETKDLRHYRIDKMESIEIGKSRRQGKEAFEKEDMSHYTSRVFGMFKGEEKDVHLRFSNSLAGAARDVLGSDLMFIPDGTEHFTTHAKVQISSHFFGWLFALGEGVEILEPEDVRQEMIKQIDAINNNYCNKK